MQAALLGDVNALRIIDFGHGCLLRCVADTHHVLPSSLRRVTSSDTSPRVFDTQELLQDARSLTCENVLDATGDFPRIEGCRFMDHEADEGIS